MIRRAWSRRLRRSSALAAAALCLVAPAFGAAEPRKAPPAAPAPAAESSGPAVTFTGFRMLDGGGSQIEVTLTSEVRVEESVRGKNATYLLVGARVPVRNNRNPLITRDFDSVVTSARIVEERPKKKRSKGKAEARGVRLVVDMREAVRPQQRVVKNADGTATLVVQFPRATVKRPPDDP